jgi:hypothetical protein
MQVMVARDSGVKIVEQLLLSCNRHLHLCYIAFGLASKYSRKLCSMDCIQLYIQVMVARDSLSVKKRPCDTAVLYSVQALFL